MHSHMLPFIAALLIALRCYWHYYSFDPKSIHKLLPLLLKNICSLNGIMCQFIWRIICRWIAKRTWLFFVLLIANHW